MFTLADPDDPDALVTGDSGGPLTALFFVKPPATKFPDVYEPANFSLLHRPWRLQTDSPLKADEMPKTLQDRACRIARYHDARTGLDANYGAEARVKALYVRKMYEEYEEAHARTME